jgi:hypothetical protein
MVTLDNSDDPSMPPNIEMFSIKGLYQYKNDGGAAFRSHMTMAIIFDNQEITETMWSVLPAQVGYP